MTPAQASDVATLSTRTHNVWIWGHCWVVLAVNVNRGRDACRVDGTPIVLARQLIATLMRWFPGRKFILHASHAGAVPPRRRLTLELDERRRPRDARMLKAIGE